MNINGEELLILIVLAVIVIGPERLPKYAEQLAQMVKQLKKLATGATEMVKEELGEEAKDLDLSQLDPRKYDPRRIVREALAEDVLPTSKPARTAASRRTTPQNRRAGSAGSRAKPNSSKQSAATAGTAAATAAGTTAVVDAATEAEVSADTTIPFDDEAT